MSVPGTRTCFDSFEDHLLGAHSLLISLQDPRKHCQHLMEVRHLLATKRRPLLRSALLTLSLSLRTPHLPLFTQFTHHGPAGPPKKAATGAKAAFAAAGPGRKLAGGSGHSLGSSAVQKPAAKKPRSAKTAAAAAAVARTAAQPSAPAAAKKRADEVIDLTR